MGSRPLVRRSQLRQGLTFGLTAMVVSALVTLASSAASRRLTVLIAVAVLLLIIAIGVLADIVGVAIATADAAPFNAMATKRVPGARQALRLIRNASRASAIFNDVIGDIAGTVAGAAGAAIAVRVYVQHPGLPESLLSALIVSLTAGLTIGAKAVGKEYAISSSTSVTLRAGAFLKALEDRFGLVLFADQANRGNRAGRGRS